ncbi:DUF2878 domain-containing protein [Aliiglaciecola sp. LCG003]|uniref:DUF2878 domain-containing protein n=1 Tax=Aliiglaciecola sp. LCG003 TaxID=3053655 RepID=UPI002573E62A|nr:DUF2878 domain-containing protein [Aliiglaciecola sp. LCG003]WJG09606.1 DUF2878 domain-containing protein [Aliiglaciecola sp. LCG003]
MLINSILFNAAWLGCILLGNNFSYLVLLWAAVHLFYSASLKSELFLLSAVTVLGVIIDTVFMHLGVFQFDNAVNIIPFWLAMIWLAFAMTVNGYLKPMQEYKILQYLVGAIFPPLSYFAGMKFGVVSFGYSSEQTLLILSITWACLLPSLFYINRLIQHKLRVQQLA